MQNSHIKAGAGHRRVTQASLSSARLGRSYRNRNPQSATHVTRTMALQVAKRAAAAMGLKSTKIALIDQIFAFTKARDWTDHGISPVIWPGNETLARRLGIGISTLKHHLVGLLEAGLIAYTDHPTYQRGGRRDEEGRIVEGYGIDLSPIAVRYAELLDIAETAEHDARLRQQLSYRRTSLRREIEGIIVAARRVLDQLDDTWHRIQAQLDSLREQRLVDNDERAQNVEALQALRDDAENAFDLLFTSRNFNSALPKFRPLQATADLPHSAPCKDERNCAPAQSVSLTGASGAMAFEEKPAAEVSARQAKSEPADPQQDDITRISLPLIRSACPNLVEMVPDALDHWTTLRASGTLLCRLAYINPQVYHEAQTALGQDLAVVALALTVERNANGSVSNPGGYLRALTQRGREGSLYLSRSLFALSAASPQTRQ